MEEFSDTPQSNLPENETTDISIFNMLEITPSKIALPQPEKKLPPKDKKANKQDESIQDLFDYVTEDTYTPVASTFGTSGTSETSKTPELVIDEPGTSKLPDSKPINEVSSAILPARTQREEHFRKWAIDHGENLDVFVTITEKDRLDSIAFRDRIETDSGMCGYAKEMEEDPNEYMDMKVQERLIGEEIICHSLEKDGIISFWLDTDEKWKKTVSILQENGMLW